MTIEEYADMALALEPGQKLIVITRTHQRSRDVLNEVFINILDKGGRPEIDHINTFGNYSVVFTNGAYIWFVPLSDIRRLKGIEYTYLRIEDGVKIDINLENELKARVKEG